MLEEVANIFNINMFNVCTTFNWCFLEAGFNGKVFIDRINKYGFLNKMAVEAKATKDKKTIVTFFFTTVETPMLHIFCPFILEKVLNVEHLEMKLDHVVTGDEKTITICLNSMKLVVKMKPSMIESELLIGQVSHLKYVHEFKFENKETSFLLAGKSKLHLHEKSPLYKSLYYLSPTYACFKDMTTDYHVEIVDKATGKVDVRFSVLKDTLEMFQLVAMMKSSMIECEVLMGQVSQLKLDYVVTGDEKTITISLNYIDTKLVAKMKPSMIEYEVLIGQVSHLKYVHEFMFENNKISFLVAGKSKLHLDEKSYLYKTLYYLSPSYACFKDMTTD